VSARALKIVHGVGGKDLKPNLRQRWGILRLSAHDPIGVPINTHHAPQRLFRSGPMLGAFVSQAVCKRPDAEIWVIGH
jgi:hypothetical protein